MDVEQVVQLVFGIGFGAHVFNQKKPWWARIAYGLVGYELLTRALRDQIEPVLQANGLGRGATDPALSPSGSPLKFQAKSVRTIDERVAYVKQQALKGVKDPVIYKRTRDLLTKKCNGEWCIGERDHKGELGAIFADVRKNVRYTWDPKTYDAFQEPRRTLELQAGDCDDSAALICSMAMSVGYATKLRVVQTTGEATYNHIYPLALMPGGDWVCMDASMPKPFGWEVPMTEVIKFKDFEIDG